MGATNRDRAGRHDGRRGGAVTPAELGASLRAAREGSGASLTDLHDRTGVPWRQLEALEQGDLAAFADQRALVTALRRYADCVGADADALAPLVLEHWHRLVASATGTTSPVPGVTPLTASAVRRPATAGTATGRTEVLPGVSLTGVPVPLGAAPTGHLRRYPDDGDHLRAFTQTAQVPGLRAMAGGGGDGGLRHTGVLPVVARVSGTRARPPVPWPLRLAVWLTALAVVVASGALVVHRDERSLARTVRSALSSVRSAVGLGNSPPPLTSPPRRSATSAPPVAVTADPALASATVTVHAARYAVVVAALAPVWVEAATPQNPMVFAQVMQAGDRQVFDPAAGRLSLQFGGSFALVQVQIDGKTVPGWFYRPTTVPFTLQFVAAS